VPISENLKGSVFMAVAMAGFTLSDAISKTLFSSMGMGEMMALRGVFASALIALLAWSRGAFADPRQLAHPMVVLRVAAECLATIAFFAGLERLPLPVVTAIMQALPLAITAGAALAFGEQVGWRRWSAILVGFAGVLLIVKPGTGGFTAASLYVLLCVALVAVRDLATRRVPASIPTMAVSAVTAPAVMATGATYAAIEGGWVMPGPAGIGLLAISAVLLLIGYQFIILAMRTGDVSFVAPFRYTALVWALVLGVVVFAMVPDRLTLIGSAIVVVSGLYMLWRERLRRHPVAAETVAASVPADGL